MPPGVRPCSVPPTPGGQGRDCEAHFGSFPIMMRYKIATEDCSRFTTFCLDIRVKNPLVRATRAMMDTRAVFRQAPTKHSTHPAGPDPSRRDAQDRDGNRCQRSPSPETPHRLIVPRPCTGARCHRRTRFNPAPRFRAREGFPAIRGFRTLFLNPFAIFTKRDPGSDRRITRPCGAARDPQAPQRRHQPKKEGIYE